MTNAATTVDLDDLHQAFPGGFSIPEVGDDPEVHIQTTEDYMVELSLVGGSLGDTQIATRLTTGDAFRLGIALLALAESNR